MPISKRIVSRINEEIETAFARLRTRFFGGDKELRIGWTPYEGLAGLYRASVEGAGGVPEKETEQNLVDIAHAYLEGVKARLRSETLAAITAADRGTETQKDLGTRLTEVWEKASSEVERVADTEAQRARQTGALDGISQASAAMGVEDPTVFWVVVRDARLCDECRRLHLLPSGKPRVWKLSEVGSDYHKKGEEFPKHNGLHPHCRCTLTFLPPGMGFSASGMIKWIGSDHDEYAAQHGE
jgi:hypothetical protein